MRTFFVPSHITGFFQLLDHEDPVKTGSRGGGIVIDKGVNTGVVVKDAPKNSVKVYYDGKICPCKTTRSVVGEVLKRTCGNYEVEVHHFPHLPVAYGFGISASGALGTVLALNDALELELGYKEIGQIAHVAEVRNNTGRGDVAAELSRGLVIRQKEGAPGTGKLKEILFNDFVVSFIIGKPRLTKTVISNRTKRAVINSIGKICIDAILEDPTPTRFMELSKKFTLETGLAQKSVEKAVLTLEKAGFTAGMCMLGNSVFALTDEPEGMANVLSYPSIISKPLQKDLRSLNAA
jgi:pantoate kinase